MKKTFSHPLARRATIAHAHRKDGSAMDALLVVTTLELDPKAKGYKADKVERLHAAAREFIADAPEIGSYAVLARPKDWDV